MVLDKICCRQNVKVIIIHDRTVVNNNQLCAYYEWRNTNASDSWAFWSIFCKKLILKLDIETTPTCLPLHHTVKKDKQVPKGSVWIKLDHIPHDRSEDMSRMRAGGRPSAPQDRNRCVAPAHYPLYHWLAFGSSSHHNLLILHCLRITLLCLSL